MRSSEKNRIQNCMTVSNIGIASVLKDPFCKTATEIMSYLLEHTSDTMDEKAVRKLIKKGTKATSAEIIESIKGYNIETDQAKKLELARNHLDCPDGMIAQTEVELYVRIAKDGDYLKPVMVQCALSAIRSKKQPYFAVKYNAVKRRRGHKKAIIAIARMMMVCIYHMISEKKPFAPTDYHELTDVNKHEKRVILNEENALAFLATQGYDTSKLVKCNDN